MTIEKIQPGFENEPPVFLDADYVERLQNLAFALAERNPDVSERLMRELDRATVLPASTLPSHVVNIGSRVTYRDNALGSTHCVTLVMPGDADISAQRVSVLTPIGAALIGLSEGAEISWSTRGGEVRRLTVVKVARPS